MRNISSILFKGLLGFGGFTAIYGGCSKSVAVGLGRAELCTINSECENPLVCTFAKCHAACKVTRDCATGERCIPLPEGPVCQLPTEQGCTSAADCVHGTRMDLKCAVDNMCRIPCLTRGDCNSDQVCNTHVCADPDQLDPDTGNLTVKNPNGYMGEGVAREGGAPDADVTPDASISSVGDATTSVPDADGAARVLCGDGGNPLQAFHPSNLPADYVPGTDDWVPNSRCELDTDTKIITACNAKPSRMDVVSLDADGHEALVISVANFTLGAGINLNLTGKRAFIIAATGKINVTGTIQISTSAQAATGWYAAGAPGPGTAQHNGFCPLESGIGGGARGGGTYSLLGAGGGGYCGKGGSGTGSDAGAPAPGGMPYGTPELVPLLGGSTGGSTASFSNLLHGGGAVELVAGESILIDNGGVINMGGSGSGAGKGNDGVGGASGGAILLEAPSVKVIGTLAANGAGGAAQGEGATATPNDIPALGSYFQGSSGTRTGSGSAAMLIDGADAPAVSPSTSYGGGGGGGAGRIRINTGCGNAKPIISPSAVISPHVTTPCYSEGLLK